MSKQIFLDAPRLFFQPVDSTYCTDAYLSWLNDAEVTRYMEIFQPYTKDQLLEFLKKAESNEELLFWAIHVKESGKHIGNIKIDPVNRRHRHAELGLMIGDKEEWGKGYAREATEKIVQYCFEQEHLHKITLGVLAENVQAIKLYEKVGFEREGIYREHVIFENQFCSVIRMAIFSPKENHVR